MNMDPIADMLTRIRNAQAVGKLEVSVPFSKMKLALSKVLKDNNFIKNYKKVSIDDKKFFIDIELEYVDSEPRICKITRVSKPGGRVYVKNKNLHKYLRGHGIYVVSTPKGLMSDRQAKKDNLGGELICSIW